MNKANHEQSIWQYCIIALTLSFLVLQIFLNYHQMITPDEFWLVQSIYQKYRSQLPYRDFIPYKPVLGYYLLLLPLHFQTDPFYAFVNIKNVITIINTLFLGGISYWLTRHFPIKAVTCSLFLLVTTTFLVEISNDIRVDIFGYWLCLISALLILENQIVFSGLIIGLAFCVTQKTAWFILASNAGLFAIWCSEQRAWTRLKPIMAFNLAFGCILCLYFSFWSVISDMQTVTNSLFLDALTVYKIDIYNWIDRYVMRAILLRNDPLYLTLWIFAIPLTLLCCASKQRRRLFIAAYSLTAMLLLTNYKQPFGYAVIAVIPALLLLYSDFFTILFQFTQDKKIPDLIVPRTTFFLLMFFCSLLLCLVSIEFPVIAKYYLVIASMPFLLGLHTALYPNKALTKFRLPNLIVISILACGLISAYKMLPIPPKTGYLYQKQALHLVKSLTADGSQYIAGVDLLYDQEQPISGNSFLLQSILYLNTSNDELKSLQLKAIELDPKISIQRIVRIMENEPIKVAVNSLFFASVPALESYLKNHYDHLWGNIYIYAPRIAAGKSKMNIKFTGHYRIESKEVVEINGEPFSSETIVFLQKGKNTFKSDNRFHLTYIPENLPHLPEKFAADIPRKLTEDCSITIINHKKRCLYL